ncbi:MAG: dethiobiotin synthase [Chthoniobacterales bacterium]
MSVFVTGTDTAVGKTSFTVWLLQRLRERGVRVAGYKPICCGDRNDASQLLAASSPGLTIDEINPVWLHTPAAPLTAATLEHREIDRAALGDGFVRLEERFDFVAVEGVGGWIVPITTDYYTCDLAAELRLPVIVIARNRLGCLNHVFLTLRSVEAAGLAVAGVVLNNLEHESDVAAKTNAEILQRCLILPVLPRFDRESAAIPVILGQMLPGIGHRLLSN